MDSKEYRISLLLTRLCRSTEQYVYIKPQPNRNINIDYTFTAI